MKNEVVLISVKAEHGLLSICDGTTKALMPIFGSLKLIDIYLRPLLRVFGKSITLLADGDEEGLKEYIIYRYPSSRINIQLYGSPEELVSYLQRAGKNRRLILIFTDHYVEPQWVDEIITYADMNNNLILEILNEGIFGIILVDISLLSGIRDLIRSILKRKPIDNYLGKNVLSHFSRKTIMTGVKRISSVIEYYEFHTRALEDYERMFKLVFYFGTEEETQILIARSGFVKKSFIYPSSLIEGMVENSIIGRNTRIGSGSIVKNSIIMENNYIGSECIIQNSIVCDNREPFSRIIPNFADGVVIGGSSRKGANRKYPEYIRGGLTLIGRGVEVPKGVKLPENCFIASGVGKNSFKDKKLFEEGESLLI